MPQKLAIKYNAAHKFAPDLRGLMQKINTSEDKDSVAKQLWTLIRNGLQFEYSRDAGVVDKRLKILGDLGSTWNDYVPQNAHKTISNKDELDAFVVKLYTTNAIYRYANQVLRAQTLPGYEPSAIDLDLAPFLLQLDAAIFSMPASSTATTYRGMKVPQSVIDEYTGLKDGTRFAWSSFTSSSKKIDVAQSFGSNTIFQIDNSKVGAKSPLRPRDVSGNSAFGSEAECLYHAATAFKKTGSSVANGVTTIQLETTDFGS